MRFVPPLFPRRDRLHSNLRLAVGLIFNVLMGCCAGPGGCCTVARGPEGSGVFGDIMMASAVPCVAVAVLLPVFFLGRPAQRMTAIGLLFSTVTLWGVGVLGALFR
jgi:hypothetical protein